MSADLAQLNSLSPPSKKRKISLEESRCGLETIPTKVNTANGSGNGSANMDQKNGASNGATNGTDNGAGKTPADIDEGLYSRQLFVLGKFIEAIFHTKKWYFAIQYYSTVF